MSDYNQNTQPTEVSYYPVDHKPPKKKGGAFLKALAAVTCAIAISAASISGYIVYSDYVGKDLPAKQSEQEENASVPQHNEEAVVSDKSGEASAPKAASSESLESIIKLSSDTTTLTTPEVVQKVTPSVVGVSCNTPVGKSTGSGIIMTSDGYIITNAHVVADATEVSALLSDGTEYEAEIIGSDRRTDLALIKISPSEALVPAEFGDSDDLLVGETVVAIGNPLGFDFYGSATSGIISGLNRTLTIEDRTLNLIQTDAAINGGNSGGPLVNSYGQVIGINSAKVSTTVAEGMGFSIPINEAIPIIDDLLTSGYVTGRPLIGITGFDIDEQVSAYYGFPVGVYIAQLYEGSPADNAGLAVGDVIIGINGREITTMNELNEIKSKYKPGDAVTLEISRNSEKSAVRVILGEETE